MSHPLVDLGWVFHYLAEQASLFSQIPNSPGTIGDKIQPVNNQTKVKEQMEHPVDLGRSGHKGLFDTYSQNRKLSEVVI